MVCSMKQESAASEEEPLYRDLICPASSSSSIARFFASHGTHGSHAAWYCCVPSLCEGVSECLKGFRYFGRESCQVCGLY